MVYVNKKFSFVCDEVNFVKLQTLLNKTNIQQKDFQGLAIALIDKVYIQSKGKALK